VRNHPRAQTLRVRRQPREGPNGKTLSGSVSATFVSDGNGYEQHASAGWSFASVVCTDLVNCDQGGHAS
jgi:hypothetical protein